MKHTLLICSSSVERNDGLLFINLDGGQVHGGSTIAFSVEHAAIIAREIMKACTNQGRCVMSDLPEPTLVRNGCPWYFVMDDPWYSVSCQLKAGHKGKCRFEWSKEAEDARCIKDGA